MSAIDITNLAVLLTFLVGPVGMAAWAIYFSNLFRSLRTNPIEKITPLARRLAGWLRQRSPETTQLLHLLGALGVPGLAKVIVDVVPPETLAFLQPHYAFITLLILTYIGGQFWFLATKEEPVGVSAISEVSPQGDQSLTLQVGGAPATPPAVVDTTQYGTGYIDPKS